MSSVPVMRRTLLMVVVAVVACSTSGKTATTTTRPEQVTVHGTVDLGSPFFDPGIGRCSGTDENDDIDSGVPVVVRNDDGKFLARTVLGYGKQISNFTCLFPFTVRLSAGEAHYVVKVGHRDEVAFTWRQVKTRKVTVNV